MTVCALCNRPFRHRQTEAKGWRGVWVHRKPCTLVPIHESAESDRPCPRCHRMIEDHSTAEAQACTERLIGEKQTTLPAGDTS